MAARSRSMAEASSSTSVTASSNSGAARQDTAIGRDGHRAPRKELPPFGSSQLGNSHEDAVLNGRHRCESIPLLEIEWASASGRCEVSRRGRAHDDDQLCSGYRENRGGHRVPRVLTDEHTKTPESRVEGADLGAGLHEAPSSKTPYVGRNIFR